MSITTAAPWDFTDLTPPCDFGSQSVEELALAESAARQYLHALSGGRVGVFTTLSDLYRAACSEECGSPYKNSDGVWRNGGRGGSCCSLDLERQPVMQVNAVTVGDSVLDPLDYTLEGNQLIRLGECFPCVDDCDPAQISVDYQWGLPPSPMAKMAAMELMCEFIASWSGGACRLPSRVTSIARQGVNIELDSPAEWAAVGLTGLALVDAYIRTVNPNGLVTRSRVSSPDLPKRVG